MIRFAKAFAENTYLTHLDLSWNSVGDNGAMILAQSLRSNETLRILDVTHDEIKEKGALGSSGMAATSRCTATIASSSAVTRPSASTGLLLIGIPWTCHVTTEMRC